MKVKESFRTRTILVVDDDEGLRWCVVRNLRSSGFQVVDAGDAETALKLFHAHSPELIVLDVMLPGMDGFAFARLVREESEVPIIMLTVRTDDKDMVKGLGLGANDYVTKPFDVQYLLDRVNRLLPSAGASPAPASDRVVRAGDMLVDRLRQRITVAGRELSLAPKEYKLLAILASNCGRTISDVELLSAVFGDEFRDESEYLSVYVQNLRSKIASASDAPSAVIRKTGDGYTLCAVPEPD